MLINMKKSIYLGIGLILIAIVIFLFSRSVGISSIMKDVAGLMIMKNVVITNNSFYTLKLSLSNTPLAFYAIASNDINFYLMNSKAYNTWNSSYFIKKYGNGIVRAEHLEKDGIIMIYNNTKNMGFPIAPSYNVSYVIKNFNNTNITNSTYYLVADNTNGSKSNSTDVEFNIRYFPNLNSNNTTTYQNYNKLKNSWKTVIIETLIAGIFFVIGIITILYMLIKKKRKKNKEKIKDKNEDYINELYKNIDKHIRGNKKPTRKKKKTEEKSTQKNKRGK